jgi:hypothetical protein
VAFGEVVGNDSKGDSMSGWWIVWYMFWVVLGAVWVFGDREPSLETAWMRDTDEPEQFSWPLMFGKFILGCVTVIVVVVWACLM